MDVLLLSAIAVAAVLLGLVAGWFARSRRVRQLAEGLDAALRQRDQLEYELNGERESHEREVARLTSDFDVRRAELRESQQRQIDDQQQRFDETMRRVEEQMKNATADMLRQRQRDFMETSNENIGQIVTPLRETINQMRKAIDDNTLRQTQMTASMRENMESMMKQSAAAQKSTEELTRVFRFGNKVQGDWGETVLSELLQSQGLTPGIHYDTQVTMSADGTQLRPDIILHLDQSRELIIDAKVSLSAYLDYVNAPDEATRQVALKAHVESLRRHVRELAAKDYSNYVGNGKQKMDYVIMFVPHSGALWAALHAKPDLWRRAMEQNVFIADEQTLFAALRIISLTWTQIRQTEQHEQVYKLATEMLDRVGQFVKRYENLGKALETARTAYDEGKRKLDPGGQSILNTAKKLTELGAKQSNKNPIKGLE